MPIPRLPDNSDRDFSVGQSKDQTVTDMAKLFAALPPTVDDYFADAMVRTRVGVLITGAMNKLTTSQPRTKPR
ncbi:MAG TPA: hypothetical protein VMR17_04545 [Xanthobacteraceae bacterium]|nr:hypothetical protein [Xanthobacteraceae bacterium]